VLPKFLAGISSHFHFSIFNKISVINEELLYAAEFYNTTIFSEGTAK